MTKEQYKKYRNRLPEIIEGIRLVIKGLRMQLDVYKELPDNSTFAVQYIRKQLNFNQKNIEAIIKELNSVNLDEEIAEFLRKSNG